MSRLVSLPLILLLLTSTSGTICADDATALKQFEQHVRPLLETRCLKCHGEKKQEGGLRLDSLDGMLTGRGEWSRDLERKIR